MIDAELYDWPRIVGPLAGFEWSEGGVWADFEGKPLEIGAQVTLIGDAVAFNERGGKRGIWKAGTDVKVSAASAELGVVYFEGPLEGEFGEVWLGGAIPADRVKLKQS